MGAFSRKNSVSTREYLTGYKIGLRSFQEDHSTAKGLDQALRTYIDQSGATPTNVIITYYEDENSDEEDTMIRDDVITSLSDLINVISEMRSQGHNIASIQYFEGDRYGFLTEDNFWEIANTW